MFYMPDNFSTKEKNACVKALLFVLFLHGGKNATQKKFMTFQLRAMGLTEDKYDLSQAPCKFDELVKSLKNLDGLRAQRYIIRAMIMLALADQDINDDAIKLIYRLAEEIGMSSEKVGDFFIWAAKGIEWRVEGIQLVEEDL